MPETPVLRIVLADDRRADAMLVKVCLFDLSSKRRDGEDPGGGAP